MVKQITFLGHAAHAGGAPHRGINALNAATLALQAIHANRETFRDQDMIRVHPIITRGGDIVNAVPAEVRMETYVRGRTLKAITDANRKVDRALQAGRAGRGSQGADRGLCRAICRSANDPELTSLYKDKRGNAGGVG